MLPAFANELGKFFDQLRKAGAPEACYPRMFFFGHDVVYSLSAPEGSWKSPTGEEFEYFGRVCRWRCRSCKHEWESEAGEICPVCKAESR